jgi:hypothetical protein
MSVTSFLSFQLALFCILAFSQNPETQNAAQLYIFFLSNYIHHSNIYHIVVNSHVVLEEMDVFSLLLAVDGRFDTLRSIPSGGSSRRHDG